MLQQNQADWNGYAGTPGTDLKLWWIAGTCYKGNLGDNQTTSAFPGSANGYGDLVRNAIVAINTVWVLASVAFVTGMGMAFYYPAYSAMLPALISQLIVVLKDTALGSVVLVSLGDVGEIAGRLGMKPESLSRAFAKLRELGVRVNQSSAAISSVSRLHDLAHVDAFGALSRVI